MNLAMQPQQGGILSGSAPKGLPVRLREQPYVVRTLSSQRDLDEAYRLRHRVFCEELGWVPPAPDKRETDEYDRHAVFLGVMDENDELLAYLRLILGGNAFMLEREFRDLIGSEHAVRTAADTAEVSRLCTKPEARSCMVSGNFGTQHISMILYKGVYHWCRLNAVRYLYLVVETKIHRLLNAKGFPCSAIGDSKTMPDGAVAVAALLDWKNFDARNASLRPAMYGWFTRRQSTPFEPQRRQRESYSSRRASA